MVSRIGLHILSLVLLWLLTTAAWAEAPIVATAVKTDLLVGETLKVEVVAQGKQVREPLIPRGAGIRFESRPTFQRTSYLLGKTTKRWTYRAKATAPGAWTIPPFHIRIDNRLYESNTIAVSVRRREEDEAPPAKEEPSPPARVPEQDSPTLDDVVFLETHVSERNPYQGEMFVLTMRLLALDEPGVVVHTPRSTTAPETDGFYTGKVTESEGREEINGLRYQVAQFRQPLFPTAPGEYTVGPWRWKGRVSGRTTQGMQTKELDLATDPIHVTVEALPDRPPGFSGAVGRFTVEARLVGGEAELGVPTGLILTVKGVGNPDAISPPPLPEIPWAQISAPESKTKHLDQRRFGEFEKTIRYPITPLEPGPHEIPTIPFCYFLPALGKYRSDEIGPFPVTVGPSKEDGSLVVLGGVGGVVSQTSQSYDDALEPLPGPAAAMAPYRPGHVSSAFALVLAPLGYLVVAVYLRRKQRFEADPAFAREYFARSVGRKRLDGVLQATEPADALFRALADYVADRLGANAAGITSQEANRLLMSAGVPADTLEGIGRVLRACERARYAGAALNRAEAAALVRAAGAAMDALEKHLGRQKSEDRSQETA